MAPAGTDRAADRVPLPPGTAWADLGVLHNLGNVLNSLNVSALLLAEKVRASRMTHLAQVAALLREHIEDWPTFAATDEKGRRLPGYLIQLAEHLAAEQTGVQAELDVLLKSVEHIKSIIGLQQRHARIPTAVEEVSVRNLVDEVLQTHAAAFACHRIRVERDYQDVPTVWADKDALLHVLINLVRNAQQSLRDSAQTDRQLTVRVVPLPVDRLRIEVRDNGVGISTANLACIWEVGFTTKEDGHGLGLHHSALAARALGGSLAAYSDGPGQGATFVFDLPLRVGEAAHA
jgi:two-component system sensor kinase FixL